MKRSLKVFLALFAVVMAVCFMAPMAKADHDDVKPKKISAVSSKRKTVRKGREFELKVQMNPSYAEDDYLSWSITKGKKVLRFDDDDRHDDEVELKAVKAGSATVVCRIRGTKEKVTFKIKVRK